jgi:hypothetical protein
MICPSTCAFTPAPNICVRGRGVGGWGGGGESEREREREKESERKRDERESTVSRDGERIVFVLMTDVCCLLSAVCSFVLMG